MVSGSWAPLSTDAGAGVTLTTHNVLAGLDDLALAEEGKEYTATREIGGVTELTGGSLYAEKCLFLMKCKSEVDPDGSHPVLVVDGTQGFPPTVTYIYNVDGQEVDVITGGSWEGLIVVTP